jgi:hypothetical protein
MTTAFILTNAEWQFALRGEGDALSLVAKGLARLDRDGGVELGPELALVAEEAANAARETLEPGVFALRGRRFCLLVTPYPHTNGAVKIALYKDSAALAAAIDERSPHGKAAR